VLILACTAHASLSEMLLRLDHSRLSRPSVISRPHICAWKVAFMPLGS
jgi:hypothetical protein